MAWTDDTVHQYAGYISRHVRDAGLLHFEAGAVAQVIEFAARLREHQAKLSARLLDIANLLEEASFWAGKEGHQLVGPGDVDHAIASRRYRSNLLEERLREMIGEGTVVIQTAGRQVGQINGLSVIEVGDNHFGIPSRITATVAVGRGTLTSVERQIELSGPIHSKGFLTLGGYLTQQYAQQRPLAVRATLAFEQSYEGVEGDSASSTELYALLSALSGLPIDQGIAVTGSVDQRGDIQAVGGVTDKIEGFFRVCQARGLTGSQGVMIPAANVPHLMLSQEVVEAVRQGTFHVWAVRTADEGITRLTGRPAGARQADGAYPEGSVHRLVDERLLAYTEHLRALETDDHGASEH
jgi:predicted ATP-dependent protease